MADTRYESNIETDRGAPKRPRDELGSSSNSYRDVFVNNIPYNISQAGSEAALKRIFSKYPGFIGVKKVLLQKGIGFVTFDSDINAENAAKSNQNQSLGPRKLFVQVSDPSGGRSRRDTRGNERRNDGNEADSSPNPDCWFCLANPTMETQGIFSMDETASIYLSLAKGPIEKFHSFLCPVTHFGCFASASAEVRQVCSANVENFRKVLAQEEFDLVYYERWIPLNASSANHMQIHLIPVRSAIANVAEWVSIMKSKAKESDIEFVAVTNHEEVVEKMQGLLGRVSYLFISFPGKDGTSPECWLGIGKMTFQFPREIICTALNRVERIDWKSCQQDEVSKMEDISFLKGKFNQL